eukprot:1897804-Amphidinium_carterae.1
MTSQTKRQSRGRSKHDSEESFQQVAQHGRRLGPGGCAKRGVTSLPLTFGHVVQLDLLDCVLKDEEQATRMSKRFFSKRSICAKLKANGIVQGNGA